jgi:hypothetical protein
MAHETNSLGLDFDSIQTTAEEQGKSGRPDWGENKFEPPKESLVEPPKPPKPEPYINPQRVNTGGPARVTPCLLVLTYQMLTP